MSLRQNAFLLLVAAALLGIAGDWSATPELARFWRLPLGLLLAGLAYEAFAVQRFGLELRVRAPAQWLLGRPAAVVLELGQRQPRSLAMELAPEAPAGIEIDRTVRQLRLEAGYAQLGLAAIGQRLGTVRWPAQRARIAGPLGLGWWPQRLTPDATVSVRPNLLEDASGAAGALSGGGRPAARAGAGGEVLQLRSYRPGDPVRSIDWKASARRAQLISRDFVEDQHLDVIVAIDAGRSSGVWCDGLDRLGHYVNVAARFAQHAVAHDDRVGIVVFGDRPLAALPPARGAAAIGRVRALLGAVTVQSTDSNPIHAAARIRALVRRRCLVILLTDIDDAATGSQLAAAVRLLRPQHLPFVVGLKSRALDDFAGRAGTDWLRPYRALALEERRRHQRLSIAALAAGGVRALIVQPDELERRVFGAYSEFRRRRLV